MHGDEYLGTRRDVRAVWQRHRRRRVAERERGRDAVGIDHRVVGQADRRRIREQLHTNLDEVRRIARIHNICRIGVIPAAPPAHGDEPTSVSPMSVWSFAGRSVSAGRVLRATPQVLYLSPAAGRPARPARRRLRRALDDKAARLQSYQKAGTRTVLLLDVDDVALSNRNVGADAFARAAPTWELRDAVSESIWSILVVGPCGSTRSSWGIVCIPSCPSFASSPANNSRPTTRSERGRRRTSGRPARLMWCGRSNTLSSWGAAP